MIEAPRLVATDLDGTLVRSDGAVSPRTRSALAAVELAGATLVVVTGRPPRWLAEVIEQTAHRGIAICANGALVVDLHTGAVTASHLLLPEPAIRFAALLRSALPDVAFGVEYADGFGHDARYRPRWPPPNPRTAEITELLDRPVAKLLVRSADHDADGLLDAARDAARAAGVTITHSSRDGLLEVSAQGVTKASTLAGFAADLGVGAAQIAAFGDMPNDIPLLRWAGHAVAVANAHPAVLAVADEVTASNDEDGVAVVLERWFSPAP